MFDAGPLMPYLVSKWNGIRILVPVKDKNITCLTCNVCNHMHSLWGINACSTCWSKRVGQGFLILLQIKREVRKRQLAVAATNPCPDIGGYGGSLSLSPYIHMNGLWEEKGENERSRGEYFRKQENTMRKRGRPQIIQGRKTQTKDSPQKVFCDAWVPNLSPCLSRFSSQKYVFLFFSFPCFLHCKNLGFMELIRYPDNGCWLVAITRQPQTGLDIVQKILPILVNMT